MYNFVGKDNVPFHAVMFPASLLGTAQPWRLVDHISATEYLNYEDVSACSMDYCTNVRMTAGEIQ